MGRVGIGLDGFVLSVAEGKKRKMTKQDVLQQFNIAVKEVGAAKDDITFTNPDGVIITLMDRLLQANEMEKQEEVQSRQGTPTLVTPGAFGANNG